MKNSTIYLFLILCCASCSKDDEPNFHQETVRCKVNGEDWKAFDYREGGMFGVGTGAIDLQYYKDTHFFELRAGRVLEDETVNQAISFYVPNLSMGKNTIPFRTEVFHDGLKPSACRFYNMDTSNVQRELEILTLDTINRIIEGRFNYSAINNCGDTVRVDDGYFDVQYRF